MPAEILEKLKAGAVPAPVINLIAKGTFPLPAEAKVEALIFLVQNSTDEIREQASRTLENMPENIILELLQAPALDVSTMYFFADYAERIKKLEFIEAILQNPSTPDEYLAFLATRLPPNLLEVLAVNQVRLIRSPQLMDSIEMNPQVSRDILRRVHETREEFFIKKAAAESASIRVPQSTSIRWAPPIDENSPMGIVKYGEKQAVLSSKSISGEALARVLPADALAAIDPEEKAEGLTPERVSVYQKIFKMTVPERVQLARKGSREERGILIKDPNRMVSEGVIHSPKITETEAETFSSMRNMSEEILRSIAANRDWIKNYKIVFNLVNNPKTPIPTARGFLNRLLHKDVFNLSRNKNVPDVIRKAAARLVDTRRERGHD